MKTTRALTLGTVISFAAAIGLAAAQDDQKPPKPAVEKVTVEGCLVRSTTAPDGSATSRTSADAMFRLTSINYMTSGTVVDKVLGSTTRPAEFSLVPSTMTTNKVDLGGLVNQKIEVQGDLTATAPSMAGASSASLLTGPTISVTSAKSVAKTCTQQ